MSITHNTWVRSLNKTNRKSKRRLSQRRDQIQSAIVSAMTIIHPIHPWRDSSWNEPNLMNEHLLQAHGSSSEISIASIYSFWILSVESSWHKYVWKPVRNFKKQIFDTLNSISLLIKFLWGFFISKIGYCISIIWRDIIINQFNSNLLISNII